MNGYGAHPDASSRGQPQQFAFQQMMPLQQQQQQQQQQQREQQHHTWQYSADAGLREPPPPAPPPPVATQVTAAPMAYFSSSPVQRQLHEASWSIPPAAFQSHHTGAASPDAFGKHSGGHASPPGHSSKPANQFFTPKQRVVLGRRASKLHYLLILDPTKVVELAYNAERWRECDPTVPEKKVFNAKKFYEMERSSAQYSRRRYAIHVLVVLAAILPLLYVHVNGARCVGLPIDKDAPWLENDVRGIPLVSSVMGAIGSSKPVTKLFKTNLDKQTTGVKNGINSAVAGLPVSPGLLNASTGILIDALSNGTGKPPKTVGDALIAKTGHNTEQCAIFHVISAYKFRCLLISLFLPLFLTLLLGAMVICTKKLHQATARDQAALRRDSWPLWARRWCFWPLLYFWWRFMDFQVPAVKYANDAKGDSLFRCFYSPPSVYICVTYLLFWAETLLVGWWTESLGTSVLLAVSFGHIYNKLANSLLVSTPLTRSETDARLRSWRPSKLVTFKRGRVNVLQKIMKASKAGLQQLALDGCDFAQLNELGPDVKQQAALNYDLKNEEESLDERVGGDSHPDAVAIISTVYYLDGKSGERLIDLHSGETLPDKQDTIFGELYDDEDAASWVGFAKDAFGHVASVIPK
eukprot:TRINITY_DN3785_c0_g1_i1.p1 TRINITY_DN3785_c0_g1~~TRINITY_DN3785_c0_g1_i1.p1  ORF type:complete len:637 (+),score=140.78 TRINITY_DN3785_c0_g1_i1:89-1999(+)